MKRSRLSVLWALLAVFVFVVAACGGDDSGSSDQDVEQGGESSSDGDGSADSGDDVIKIGFSQVTLQSPFYVQLRDGSAAAAESFGHELIFLDANGDVTKQNNDIQDLITQGVDALIVNPVNPEAVGPAIEEAIAAGIPVITVDRSVTNTGVTAHIGRDNITMGNLVGQAVVARLAADGIENAKIIEIQGDAGGAVMMDRRDGFHDAINGTGHEIVKGPFAEYIRSNAVVAMQDLLQAHPDVNVVYAHNDDMALGALQVLEENGRNDVLVAGVDGLSEALEVMAGGGNYIATSLNDPQYLGDVAIQVALAAINGETVSSFVDAGTSVVTFDNVDEFPRDGLLFAEYRPNVLAG